LGGEKSWTHIQPGSTYREASFIFTRGGKELLLITSGGGGGSRRLRGGERESASTLLRKECRLGGEFYIQQREKPVEGNAVICGW